MATTVNMTNVDSDSAPAHAQVRWRTVCTSLEHDRTSVEGWHDEYTRGLVRITKNKRNDKNHMNKRNVRNHTNKKECQESFE